MILTIAAAITLAWLPDQSHNVSGYKVHYGLSPGFYSQVVNVGNTTSATISGLSGGIVYYFAVGSYNQFGESAYSNVVATPLVQIQGITFACTGIGGFPGITLTASGDSIASTFSASDGSYAMLLPYDGSYTITPSKTRFQPGWQGINTVDVVIIQRHYLGISPIPLGCQFLSADTNDDGRINTVDLVAIQRFFIGAPGNYANVGKCFFIPASSPYPNLRQDQLAQSYSVIVVGDVL